MPTIRLISDITSIVFIDGQRIGQIDAEEVGAYDIRIGEHLINLVSPYSDEFSLRKVVRAEYDKVVEFSFRTFLEENNGILSKLELFRFQEDGKTGFFEPITRLIIIPAIIAVH